MTTKNRKRPTAPASRKRVTSLAAQPLTSIGSFRAVLNQCANEPIVQRVRRWHSSFVSHLKASQPKQRSISSLSRAWSWMHAKYAESATKRLRVAETVSFGDKRFVALVSVEGREFLIGGSASGVSLLAQLGSPSIAGNPSQTIFGSEGSSE